MLFLLNLLFAVLTFFAVRYIMLECKASHIAAVIAAALMALIVFLADLGSQVV